MPGENDLSRLIHWHMRLHQHVAIKDVYKLIAPVRGFMQTRRIAFRGVRGRAIW
jgi:hypothetical protein